MDKSNPPRSFGVFKPVGHTVIAFHTADSLGLAADALLTQGFSGDDMVRYTPQEMLAQVQADLQTASPIANVGQELNLVKAHGELAAAGCSFLVVRAENDEREQRVDGVVMAYNAAAAQRYGRFIVQELAADAAGAVQTFESPDRGLDIAIPGEAHR